MFEYGQVVYDHHQQKIVQHAGMFVLTRDAYGGKKGDHVLLMVSEDGEVYDQPDTPDCWDWVVHFQVADDSKLPEQYKKFVYRNGDCFAFVCIPLHTVEAKPIVEEMHRLIEIGAIAPAPETTFHRDYDAEAEAQKLRATFDKMEQEGKIVRWRKGGV